MKNDNNYLNYTNLRKSGVKLDYTKEQVIEIAKCIKDPIYFIKKYIKIVSVDRGVIPFEMWPFQERMIETFHHNRFSIAKMPRQVGKCVKNDTLITVRNKTTGKIEQISASNFYARINTSKLID